MASASTSYGFGKDGYAFDVFINARDADVNKGLARHLYRSLSRHRFRVFLDKEPLQAHENIIPQIEEALRTASLHIAIFSPGFAESPWCLNELVLMLETGKTIIPVFYDVNPSELRCVPSGHGVYARSLRDLERKTTSDSQPRYDFDTLEKWRQALSVVAEMSGVDLKAYNGDEGLLVEEVVKQVLTKVPKLPLFVAEYPTGLDNEVENFERTVLSQQKSEKTIVAGIVGIAGVGKTTLATELFDRHTSNYDGSCFLFDVREHAAKGSLNVLQRKLLKDLAQLDVDISRTDEGVETLKMHLPSSQQVLVVIDDVDHISQLEALVSPIQHTIHSSSLILVTSRDKGLLQTSGILDSFIYKQTCLNQKHSQELFCSYAFGQPYPPTVFEQMVEQYLDVCGGLPLSLKVIGALLYGRDLHDWEAELNEISKIPPTEILSRLKVSYDILDDHERQIFLDTACFFIGEDRDTAIRIWDGSHWKGRVGFMNLENKSLVEVDSANRIRMHVQLQKVGRYIAENVTPHRLWCSDDILSDHSSVRGISMVHGTDPEESFEIPTDIRGLQLLRAHGSSVKRIFSNAESPQLVWLSWYSCPFPSLPSWISVKNLRVLHIEGEILETVWQDQSEAPLELRELDIDANILNIPKSIGMLKYLEKFVLRRRKNCGGNTVDLKTLPGEICGMHSLKHLELVGCKNITSLADSVEKWTNLQLLVLGGCSALQGLPYSAGKWTRLRQVDLGGCHSLQGLPDSAGNWQSLQRIDLGGCSALQGLPESAGNWMSLQRINLGGCTALQGLPDSAGNWTSLQWIDLGGCSALQWLPDSAGNWTSLRQIDLGGCYSLQGLPDSAWNWKSLQRIDLGGCSALQGLPDSAGEWMSLQWINLVGCSALRCLPGNAGNWTSLQRIDLGGCSSLQGLPDTAENWTSLRQIDLGGCYSLQGLPDSAWNWKSLQRIDLGGWSALQGLPESAGEWMSLQWINLVGCSALRWLPGTAGNWTSLQRIDLGGCSSLQGLPDTAGNWTSLRRIDLGGCSSLQGLPNTARNWTSLQRIDLGGCSSLQGLPDTAGNWTSLRRIDLGGCSSLKRLPESAVNWKSLQRIDLGEYSPQQRLPYLVYNWKSKGLPESMGNWRHLKFSPVGSSALLYASCKSKGLPEYLMGNWRHLKYSPVGSSALLYASSISNYCYDVFISCHGPDVKRTFASHLNQRLVSCRLRPFLDEGERHEEDNIKEAIATASVHVVIFCLRYAESRRCLDELLLMLESGAPVIPIFYKVRRRDLQWTKDKDGVYGRALQNHEKRTTYDSQTNEDKPRDNSNTIEEWREALSNFSGLGISGFELQSFNGVEAELLDAVVESVFERVRKAPFYKVRYMKDLDQKVESFEKTVLLHHQSGKPRVLGIVGEPGVGKTTLAKELSNRKSSSFNRACILFDVSGYRSSLHLLQKELFKCLANMDIQIESVDQGIELFKKHALSIKNGATAFVILDNVDEVDQLKALLPVQNCLPGESLILITSRCKDVLTGSGVEQSSIYHLTDLSLDKHPSCLDRKVTDFADRILSQQQGKNPRAVGIVGIGGIGKTRLAKEFFNRKSSDYEKSYFFYDVNETARRSFSLHNLLSKLLQGLTHLDLQVEEVDEGINLFKEHVSPFPSLVILDNVVHWHQLHALLLVLSVLHSDSLILITCREEEVLKCSGVQESLIYKLDRLNPDDSRELFCTHAFGQPSPSQEFEDLADMFVRACNGLPLTLEVFGALLRGKTNSYWQTQFGKLNQIDPDHIEKRLQLCYDDLDEEEKKIFLHIACCCIGEKRGLAVRLWDASRSIDSLVFENLQKRCLVDVDSEDCLFMHEYLRELGRSIADEKGLRGRKRPWQSSNERL